MVAFDRNPQDFKYLRLLSRQFPTEQSAFTEIINLSAILNLPKGTEHFMSDVHGEYEAFMHILNNCSGVVREHVDEIFGDTLSFDEKGELCTLIYYPREKMELVKASIKAYKNISCYYIEGAEADSYVIFPYFEIQYRKAAKLMPTLTWGYVKKQEDGQYRMVSELSDTEKEYVKAVGERADVKELQDQVKEAAAVAVSEDEVLQQVYTHNGSSEVSIGTQEQ